MTSLAHIGADCDCPTCRGAAPPEPEPREQTFADLPSRVREQIDLDYLMNDVGAAIALIERDSKERAYLNEYRAMRAREGK